MLALRLLRVEREVQLVPSSRTTYQRIYVLLPPTADEAWFGVSGLSAFDRSVLTRMYGGVDPASLHATVTREGEAVAIGRGVVADGHLAIYGMETVRAHRRRGLARTVIGALARWASDQGATRATLQVEVGNDGAHALYESMGLSDIYEYSYLALGV